MTPILRETLTILPTHTLPPHTPTHPPHTSHTSPVRPDTTQGGQTVQQTNVLSTPDHPHTTPTPNRFVHTVPYLLYPLHLSYPLTCYHPPLATWHSHTPTCRHTRPYTPHCRTHILSPVYTGTPHILYYPHRAFTQTYRHSSHSHSSTPESYGAGRDARQTDGSPRSARVRPHALRPARRALAQGARLTCVLSWCVLGLWRRRAAGLGGGTEPRK